jgi:hypothetical protein
MTQVLYAHMNNKRKKKTSHSHLGSLARALEVRLRKDL